MVVRGRAFGLVRSSLLGGVLGLLIFLASNLYPLLPPILAVPLLTSFYLGLTIPLSNRQWLIAVIGSLIVLLLRGGAILPGPFIIPVYGLIFSSRRASLSGAISSTIHLIYGILLAPLIFPVAPAPRILRFILGLVNSVPAAFLFLTLVYGMVGSFAARAGLKLGEKINKMGGLS